MKTASSSDSGMEFHDALNVAVAAKSASNRDAVQAKAKSVTPESKPQERKKDLASNSSVSDGSVSVNTATQQMPTRAVEPSAPTAGQLLNNLQLANDSNAGASSFSSSLASSTSSVAAATLAKSAVGGGQKTFDNKLNSVAGSSKYSAFPDEDERVGAVANLNNSDIEASAVVPASAQSTADTATEAANSFAQSNRASTLTSNGGQLVAAVEGGSDSISSILPPVTPGAAPTKSSALAEASSKMLDGKLDVPAGAEGTFPPPASAAALQQISNASNAYPDVKATPAPQVAATSRTAAPVAIAAFSSGAQTSEAATPKTSLIGHYADTHKLTDISNASSPAPAVDPASQDVSPSAAAVAQSVIVPTSLSSAPVSIDTQSSMAASTSGDISKGNMIVDNLKGSTTRTGISAKTKSDSTAADLRGKATTDTDGTTQTTGSSTGVVPFATKVAEVTVALNQGASGTGSATFQQTSQVAQPDASSHVPQASQNVTASTEATGQTLPAAAPQETQAMQGVSSAQLIQSMRSSEMKLGMQSAEFGNISINTSLSHQALSAQISFDHLELGKALAVHLPAIEEKLGSAYGVQAKVELRDSSHSSPSSDSGYSNSGQQSREQRQSQGGGSAFVQSGMFERIAPMATTPTVSPTASASRLDIRI